MAQGRCIFCSERIEPEESFVDSGRSKRRYVYQCENPECMAVFESIDRPVPLVVVIHKPKPDLDFE